jgi:hypothetical protein
LPACSKTVPEIVSSALKFKKGPSICAGADQSGSARSSLSVLLASLLTAALLSALAWLLAWLLVLLIGLLLSPTLLAARAALLVLTALILILCHI